MTKSLKPGAVSGGAVVPIHDQNARERPDDDNVDGSRLNADPVGPEVVPTPTATEGGTVDTCLIYPRYTFDPIDRGAADRQEALVGSYAEKAGYRNRHVYRDQGTGRGDRLYAAITHHLADKARDDLRARMAAGRRAAYEAGRIPHSPS